MDEREIFWSDYMRYRVKIRGFDLARIEDIVRYSTERYVDHPTGRLIAVGKCGNDIVVVPYEADEHLIRPVTAHVMKRAQIAARVRSGRFGHE